MWGYNALCYQGSATKSYQGYETPPHQLLVTEGALLHQHLHCPEMHFVVTSLHPGQQSMAPQHGVP